MSIYSTFLKDTFLFDGLTDNDISALLEGIFIEERDYKRGELIFSPDEYDHKIGFVMKGECIIGRKSGKTFVPLNAAKSGESFGILSVFAPQNSFPTVVKAKNSCTILYFSAHDVKALIKKSPAVSMNVIEFLARKISFLNDKIIAFTGGSIEEKLVGYILEMTKKKNSLSFEFNKKKSSEALNCGRASLYRALSALENAGYVTLDSKKIIINDLEGLERILK